MTTLKDRIVSLTRAAPTPLLVGAGLVVVLTAALLWWVLAPRQQLLFGNLREADAAEIVQSLNEWKVPHKIVEGGTAIQVPSDLVYETRMRLVSAGVPRGGHVGFELFDDADFGVTEFAQRVNYQRALQGEIERTIAALPGVDTARVHLTIRRPGLFVGAQETSKASVALTLRPGQALMRQQVSGIRSLVAAAVEGLSIDAVSVINSDGSLLAGSGGGSAELRFEEHGDQEAQFEEKIRSRVAELLGQVLHVEEFRIAVDASLNFDSVHEVHELPSTLGPDAKAREEIARAPGRVERLSIAVILPPSIDEFQLANIRALISASAGVDTDRGDRLEVTRLARDQPWRSASVAELPAGAASFAGSGKPPSSAIATTWTQGLLWKWLLFAVIGGLVGVIATVAVLHQPRALKPSERDAVLSKLKGWLAEGNGQP